MTEEKRKVVSILFVDLVGHTDRSDGADPEDVRDILREYYRAVKATIERFGGVVEKFIGDAVMAVFGTPVARGDDAERAVNAALAIPAIIEELNRASAFPDLEVHLAVNTGEAVVTLDPGSADGEVLVAGDVVNTAARLQSAAAPGTVLIGEETHRAIRRSIRCDPVAPVVAKGKRDPIPAWIAVEVLSPLAERPAVLAFVGRDAELGLLRNIWDRVASEGRPHLVTILGEPGIGKTRLADELAADVRASGGQTFSVRELPYEQSSGYEAFAQLVREVAGIFESDQSAVVQTKLADALGRLGLSDPDLMQLLSVFARTPEAVADDRRGYAGPKHRSIARHPAVASHGGVQADPHPLVRLALGFGLHDAHRADLPRRADVRPPVRLFVDPLDVDHPDRIDRVGHEVDLGPDQVGVREGFLPGQQENADRSILGEQPVELRLHVAAELGAHGLELEVHASGPVGLHVPARHLRTVVVVDDARQRVQRRMRPHVRVPAEPVELARHHHTDGGRLSLDRVHDLARLAILDRVGHRDGSTGPSQDARVARLATSARVEHRPVQHHSTSGDACHGRFAHREVRVAGIEVLGHDLADATASRSEVGFDHPLTPSDGRDHGSHQDQGAPDGDGRRDRLRQERRR
jgi:class 3 adenylate cyclase